MARLGVAALGKGRTIACEPLLDPDHPWGSERRLYHVRVSIIALNLTRAVQLCVDIGAHLIAARDVPAPNTMGETFDVLALARLIPEELARRMQRAVGFRNIAVHSYEAINWEIVFAICQKHLVDFRDFAASVDALLDH